MHKVTGGGGGDVNGIEKSVERLKKRRVVVSNRSSNPRVVSKGDETDFFKMLKKVKELKTKKKRGKDKRIGIRERCKMRPASAARAGY